MDANIAPCPSCGTRNRVPAAAPGKPRCARCKVDPPWLAHADDASFGEVVAQSPLPVVVDLWAPWCGPCRTLSPLLDKVGAELAGRLKVVKVNVDEASATAARLRVTGVPTLVIFESGREVDRKVGAPSAPALRSWLTGVAAAR
ncbi:MAG: thioredoxin [Actinomycetota bacterium]|nr:thioredoxin [Actinomycetota bacterium]